MKKITVRLNGIPLTAKLSQKQIASLLKQLGIEQFGIVPSILSKSPQLLAGAAVPKKPRHVLTIAEQIKGAKALVASPKTKPAQKAGMRKYLKRLEKQLAQSAV